MTSDSVIEGAKLDIPGEDLKDLLIQVSEYHDERCQKYRQQAADIEDGDAHVEEYSGDNPVEQLQSRADTHENKAMTRSMQAAYLDESKTYRLTQRKVKKLGLDEVWPP